MHHRLGGSTDPTVAMNTPTKLGRYEILGTLGQGMQGRIYRARDSIFGEVALKVPIASATADPREREQLREHLAIEARRQRELSASCASILPAYDVLVSDDGQVYLVQAYAEGGSLRDVPRPVTDELQIADWGRQLCDALQTAHDASIFHRDVKPENVLLDRAGQLKLTDFGVAVETSRHAHDRRLVGTPPYMAPEAWEANQASAATDVFSMGVLLYELATDQHPFDLASATTPDAIRGRICTESGLPTPARVARPALSPELAEILDRAVARDPAERYRSAKAMQRDLIAHIEQLESRETQIVRGGPIPVPFRVRVRRVWRRVGRRARLPLLGLAVFVLAAGLWRFFPQTVLPQGWIEEKITDFGDALRSDDPARQFLGDVWRNADGDAPAPNDPMVVAMFAELAYYDRVSLQAVPNGFDGTARTVTVKLIGRADELADGPVLLARRTIAFEQTERGELRWQQPRDWLFDLRDVPAHRRAVHTVFRKQLWEPLREALGDRDHSALARLYDARPSSTELDEILGWLHAYDRKPALAEWPADRDPRKERQWPWVVRLAEPDGPEVTISIPFEHTGSRWHLVEPQGFAEPRAHVEWALARYVDQLEAALRTGDVGTVAALVERESGEGLTAAAREQVQESFAWLARTRRAEVRLTTPTIEGWAAGQTTARLKSTLRCVVADPRVGRTPVEHVEPLDLAFRRDEAGRWVPTDPASLAVPEPLAMGASRLLANDASFLESVTRLNQSAWPARVVFIAAQAEADVRITQRSPARIEVMLHGTYAFAASPVPHQTQGHPVTLPLLRDPVRWEIAEPPPDETLLFAVPTEDSALIAYRFAQAVSPVLHDVFIDASHRFDAARFLSLLPAETVDADRAALTNMLDWLRAHAAAVKFSLAPSRLYPAEPLNRVTIELSGRYSAGVDDGLSDERWSRELHFIEQVAPSRDKDATATAPSTWSLVSPAGQTLRDYAWPAPTLVRFAHVPPTVGKGDLVGFTQQYLPASMRTALEADLRRLAAWTTLGGTSVALSPTAKPRVASLDDGPARVVWPMRLAATFGGQTARHDVALVFAELDDPPGQWQLWTARVNEPGDFREDYIWPEPASHVQWAVNERLARARKAYVQRDHEAYALALTGSTDSAELFIEFLDEFGPDRYRWADPPSVELPEAGALDVRTQVDLHPLDSADSVTVLAGDFVWRDSDWVAASAADWTVDMKTAARLVRLLRAGLWIKAHELYETLPETEQRLALPALERVAIPIEWSATASPERHATSGMPMSIEQDGERFLLVMARWPDGGGAYALYVESDEVSTVRFEAGWNDLTAALNGNDADPPDRIPFWRTRDPDEVAGKLNGAVSGITWRQALAFARQTGRDLPTDAEWTKAAQNLDGVASRLIGGVWEWCRDSAGDDHVIRGGCWLHGELGITATLNLRDHHGSIPDDTIGFRTVIRIPTEPIR